MSDALSVLPSILDETLARQWRALQDPVLENEADFVQKYLQPGKNGSGCGPIVKILKYQVFRHAAALEQGARQLMQLELTCPGHPTIDTVIRDYQFAYDDYPSIWKMHIARFMLGYDEMIVAQYEAKVADFVGALMNMVADEYEHVSQFDRLHGSVAATYREYTEEVMQSVRVHNLNSGQVTPTAVDPRAPRSAPRKRTMSKVTTPRGSSSPMNYNMRVSGAGGIRKLAHNQSPRKEQRSPAQPGTTTGRPKRPKSRSEKFCSTVKLFLCWLSKHGGLQSLYDANFLEGRSIKADCDLPSWERKEKVTAREVWKPIGPTPGLQVQEVEMLNRAQMTVEQYVVQRRRITIGFAMLIEQNRLDRQKTAPYHTGPAQAQIVGDIDANKTSYITKCFCEFGWLDHGSRDKWFPAQYRKKCLDALREWRMRGEGEKMCQEAGIEEDVVAPAEA